MVVAMSQPGDLVLTRGHLMRTQAIQDDESSLAEFTLV